MLDWRESTQHRCIEHKDIELVPTPRNRNGKAADALRVCQVQGCNRCRAADLVNPLFNVLQPGRRPCCQDDMSPCPTQCFCRSSTDSARCARHERDLSLERPRHQTTRSASRLNWLSGAMSS